MRAALLCLVLAGSCNTSGAPPAPPVPSPTSPPPAGIFLGAPNDAMVCQLVERVDGTLGLSCDVQARFSPYLGQALQGGLQGCQAAPSQAGDAVAEYDCAVVEPYAAKLRAAIDQGPQGAARGRAR